jgi:hypothetical protein
MTTISSEFPRREEPSTPFLQRLGPPEVWPTLAISVIWLTVLFDALFGPNILTSNGAGTNTSSIPSAVVIAFFAFLASWAVARAGFKRVPASK